MSVVVSFVFRPEPVRAPVRSIGAAGSDRVQRGARCWVPGTPCPVGQRREVNSIDVLGPASVSRRRRSNRSERTSATATLFWTPPSTTAVATDGIVGQHIIRACSPASRLSAAAPTPLRGAAALTPAPRALQTAIVRRCLTLTLPDANWATQRRAAQSGPCSFSGNAVDGLRCADRDARPHASIAPRRTVIPSGDSNHYRNHTAATTPSRPRAPPLLHRSRLPARAAGQYCAARSARSDPSKTCGFAALCKALHSAAYAELRTMRSWFGGPR